MEEFLVALACLTSKGCSETSQFYYESKPELQLTVKKLERAVVTKIGEASVALLAPPLVYIVGGAGEVKVAKHVHISVSKSVSSLIFRKEF